MRLCWCLHFTLRRNGQKALLKTCFLLIFPISIWEAFGRRLRRNYIWLFLILLCFLGGKDLAFSTTSCISAMNLSSEALWVPSLGIDHNPAGFWIVMAFLSW